MAQYRDLYVQFGRTLARLQEWLLAQINAIDNAATWQLRSSLPSYRVGHLANRTQCAA